MALDPISMPTVVNRFGSTTLFQDIQASDDVIVLSDASRLPVGDVGGCIQINSEIIYFTSRTDNTLFGCKRGQDGSFAENHVRGSVVTSQIVAGNFNGLKAAVLRLEQEMDGAPQREMVEVTEDMAQLKQIELEQAPVTDESLQFLPIGGPMQVLGEDYIITGNIISWENLGLDGIIEPGDKIQIYYKI